VVIVGPATVVDVVAAAAAGGAVVDVVVGASVVDVVLELVELVDVELVDDVDVLEVDVVDAGTAVVLVEVELLEVDVEVDAGTVVDVELVDVEVVEVDVELDVELEVDDVVVPLATVVDVDEVVLDVVDDEVDVEVGTVVLADVDVDVDVEDVVDVGGAVVVVDVVVDVGGTVVVVEVVDVDVDVVEEVVGAGDRHRVDRAALERAGFVVGVAAVEHAPPVGPGGGGHKGVGDRPGLGVHRLGGSEHLSGADGVALEAEGDRAGGDLLAADGGGVRHRGTDRASGRGLGEEDGRQLADLDGEGLARLLGPVGGAHRRRPEGARRRGHAEHVALGVDDHSGRHRAGGHRVRRRRRESRGRELIQVRRADRAGGGLGAGDDRGGLGRGGGDGPGRPRGQDPRNHHPQPSPPHRFLPLGERLPPAGARRRHTRNRNAGDPADSRSMCRPLRSIRASSGSRSSVAASSMPTSAGPISRLFFLTYSNRVMSSPGPSTLSRKPRRAPGSWGNSTRK
jgi:hypothetical protein